MGKRYSHRIEIPASICFDVESENAELTDAEVNQAVQDLADDEYGFDGPGGGTRVYPVLDLATEPASVKEWELCDTMEMEIDDSDDICEECADQLEPLEPPFCKHGKKAV